MIGVPDAEADVLACIEVGGASGYLLQDTSLEALINNVRAIAIGEALCSPRIASLAFSRIAALARQRTGQNSGKLACLTGRESQIIALIESGLTNKEIALRLNIEVPTVKNHVHNILDKLQLAGRREVAKYARERGLAVN
jgi:DNA-binding NarL/FixJ family response regulator